MHTIGKVIALAALFCLPLPAAQAQIIVKVRPPRPKVVVVRPAPPSPRHVWVAEDWVVRGNKYYWHGGYWVVPPRPHAVWAPGHWRHTRRGDVWIPGRWH